MTPAVHVVTLNWNSARETAALLRSLEVMSGVAREIVAVDNGSTDDSLALLKRQFPGVTVLEAGANLGFGAANNLAIRRAMNAGAGYVWLINNDAVVAPDALAELVSTAEAHPETGAVGSVIFEADDQARVQAWGGGRTRAWLGYSRLARRATADLDFITGASLLLRVEALRCAGLFDERFFLYWEDADLCRRLCAAGWGLGVAGKSRVWHAMSATTGRDPCARAHHLMRSAVLYLRKHSKAPGICSVSALLFQSAGKLCLGNGRALRGLWSGWAAGWKADGGSDA